jgi:hypothetical protein
MPGTLQLAGTATAPVARYRMVGFGPRSYLEQSKRMHFNLRLVASAAAKLANDFCDFQHQLLGRGPKDDTIHLRGSI